MKNIPERSIFHGKCYFGKHKTVWKALIIIIMIMMMIIMINFN